MFVVKKGLGSIFKPMFFAYPGDNNAYFDEICDTQFLIGPDLLAAPILVQNTTSRKVYLPESKWYNFHTGQQYLPGTYLIDNVSLTEKIPLFMKEGSAILVQDTQFVRQTRDLGNIYQLVAGMKFDSSKSTDQVKVYRGSAAILSIKDFNDDSSVTRCINQGCTYTLNLVLNDAVSSRTLEIDSFYAGVLGLNQLVVIDKITLYYDNKKVTASLTNPVEILGVNRVVIPINNPEKLE